jgi:ferredoxin/nitrate reductase gamma subunit
MYALLVPAIFIAAYGVYQRIACWRRGKPVDRFDSTAKRFKMLFRHAILQTRLARETYSGILHRFISWGFIVLLAATAVVMVEYDFNIPLMRGHFYLYFQSLLVDAFGAFTLIGLVMAAIRRWGTKPARLVYTREGDLFLLILLLIVISGFFLEAWRIAATADPWAGWSPIGFLVARFSLLFGDGQSLGRAHRYLWWFHLLLAYGLIAFAPFMKKMLHVLTSPLNIYTANLDPIGANLKQIDLENTGVLGVNAINGFTWKDLLDLDACTECGRCTDNCPAHISGKSLSPRDIILELRVIMHQTMKKNGRGIAGKEPATVELSGKIPAESLWECTTCAACVEACPVFIEQMPKIVDMRRYLVMEKAAFPETIQNAIGSLEDRGHPIRGARATRLDWAKGLDVPLISETGDAEILFWVGSAGALLERSQRVTRALAQLLKLSGVRFAILGREEKSTGDLARRVGNEFLFKTLAEENIEILNQYHVKNIVTACPHSYNTLRTNIRGLGESTMSIITPNICCNW